MKSVEGALLDALVAGQAQVVVGAEHDPALALHLDHGQGWALEHVEVGQCAQLASDPKSFEILVLARLGEDVDRSRHAKSFILRVLIGL